jgi:hypothetical protein
LELLILKLLKFKEFFAKFIMPVSISILDLGIPGRIPFLVWIPHP